MKPPTIFSLGLAATLATMLLNDALHDDAAVAAGGMFSENLFALCILFGALLQLSTMATSGAKKLRLVSGLWMLVALVLASSAGTEFLMLVGLFFAGVGFSFMPEEKPPSQSN